jgi:hypothetical protein
MKIAGVGLWIWALGAVVLSSAVWITLPISVPLVATAIKPPNLEVVTDGVWISKAGDCEVRGQIYNPREKAARDVLITYKLWVVRFGENKKIIEDHKGTAGARIRYIPPGGTVDFTAPADTQYGEFVHPLIKGAEIAENASLRPE